MDPPVDACFGATMARRESCRRNPCYRTQGATALVRVQSRFSEERSSASRVGGIRFGDEPRFSLQHCRTTEAVESGAPGYPGSRYIGWQRTGCSARGFAGNGRDATPTFGLNTRWRHPIILPALAPRRSAQPEPVRARRKPCKHGFPGLALLDHLLDTTSLSTGTVEFKRETPRKYGALRIAGAGFEPATFGL